MKRKIHIVYHTIHRINAYRCLYGHDKNRKEIKYLTKFSLQTSLKIVLKGEGARAVLTAGGAMAASSLLLDQTRSAKERTAKTSV